MAKTLRPIFTKHKLIAMAMLVVFVVFQAVGGAHAFETDGDLHDSSACTLCTLSLANEDEDEVDTDQPDLFDGDHTFAGLIPEALVLVCAQPAIIGFPITIEGRFTNSLSIFQSRAPPVFKI